MQVVSLVVALIVLSESAVSESASLWSVDTSVDHSGNLKNRRLEQVPKTYLKVHWSTLLKAIELHSNRTLQFKLVIPDADPVDCELTTSDVLPKGLATEFPSVHAYSGVCSDDSQVYIDLVENEPDSLSANVITSSNVHYYIDHAVEGSDSYLIYRYDHVKRKRPGSHGKHKCATRANPHSPNATSDKGAGVKRKPLIGKGDKSVKYSLTLALVANLEYSRAHGNTKQKVLAQLLSLLHRSNGIFRREVGLEFTLAEGNGKLICVSGDSECKQHLSNNGDVIDMAESFIRRRGVKWNSFDLGHVLTTGAGGLAYLGVLCDHSLKAGGTTGMEYPFGDPFTIDYFMHEIGHQLNLHHTFKDCGGSFSNTQTDEAVEPGSGSTIMGYAGICGSTDLQANSDPYFHSVSLVKLRKYLQATIKNGRCGKAVRSNLPRPKVNALAKCTLPVGTAFQLAGKPVGAGNLHYSWDQVDDGVETFAGTKVASFRSWKPRQKTTKRFFPNMYYLTYKQDSTETERYAENLPQRGSTATFRFVGRRVYSTTEAKAGNTWGDFGFDDTKVTFSKRYGKLKWKTSAKEMKMGSHFKFEWSPGKTGRLSKDVKILMAINTMTRSSVFDHERDLDELDFIQLGQVKNNGKATLKIPNLSNKNVEVNIMIRSLADNCYFFDILPRVRLVRKESDLTPTKSPTKAEPVKPTPKPTPEPTFHSGNVPDSSCLRPTVMIGVEDSFAYRNNKLPKQMKVVSKLFGLLPQQSEIGVVQISSSSTTTIHEQSIRPSTANHVVDFISKQTKKPGFLDHRDAVYNRFTLDFSDKALNPTIILFGNSAPNIESLKSTAASLKKSCKGLDSVTYIKEMFPYVKIFCISSSKRSKSSAFFRCACDAIWDSNKGSAKQLANELHTKVCKTKVARNPCKEINTSPARTLKKKCLGLKRTKFGLEIKPRDFMKQKVYRQCSYKNKKCKVKTSFAAVYGWGDW